MKTEITIEQLAEKINGKLWTKGEMKRIYVDAGYNTKKMTTKTYIYQREDGTFGVSCNIDCPSQEWQWIKSQQEEVIASITKSIDRILFEYENPEASYDELLDKQEAEAEQKRQDKISAQWKAENEKKELEKQKAEQYRQDCITLWESRIADPTETRKWQSDHIWGRIKNHGAGKTSGQPFAEIINIDYTLDCRGIGGADIQKTFSLECKLTGKSSSGKSGYYSITDACRKQIEPEVEAIIDECTARDTEGFKKMLANELSKS